MLSVRPSVPGSADSTELPYLLLLSGLLNPPPCFSCFSCFSQGLPITGVVPGSVLPIWVMSQDRGSVSKHFLNTKA